MVEAVVLTGLVAIAIVAVSLAVLAGYSVYEWMRSRHARPLTDEEKWQETSVESLSEDDWSALIASLEAEPVASHVDEPVSRPEENEI